MKKPDHQGRPDIAHPASLPAAQMPAVGMSAETWQRHASPWSVYTRMATLPLLLLALWSHVWIGIGLSSIAVGLVIVWLWLNPRLFPAPKNKETWAAKATFGERVWLNRGRVPIPAGEAKTALLLSVVAGVGFMSATYGAITTNLLLALTGMIVTYAGKLVFLNRMVLLYDAMRDAHPLYRFWSSAPDNDDSANIQDSKAASGGA
ncbi:MAG: hypothetical protein HWE23_16620 [Rhodobacteraceae bacterium]|nr:hypothetical protein [Paracoccaceae bacterium]